jgi:catechol 2,3-dioxygenase-like lactoylglutathione lyase family enzyme
VIAENKQYGAAATKSVFSPQPRGGDVSPTHADPDRAGQLHHLELSVTEYSPSLPVWEWLLGELGYERKNDWDGGRSWIRDGTYVVLKRAETEGTVDRATPGLDHVAFHAASSEQVDLLTEGVRARSATTLLYEHHHPHAGDYYALYFEDPAGLTVEVVAPDDPDASDDE